MSLTSFLKTPEARQLFKVFPRINKHLIQCNGESAHPQNRLAVPRYQGANPAIVGTAYDFCCRAMTQRVNKVLIEQDLSIVVQSGLYLIQKYQLISRNKFNQLQSNIHDIWKTRIDYINGANVSELELASGALMLAEVEQAYRSGKLVNNSCTTENTTDLCNLINVTLSSRLIHTNEKMYMNPSFGRHSILIGGADADMVFGTTLIDIKTTVYTKSFQEYFEQLFGYYLLSEFDKTFETSLQNLAVYLPRFDALYYLSIDVLRGLIDIDTFAKQFLKLIEEYDA